MQTFIELVPRNSEQLTLEVNAIREIPWVSGFNIPDLKGRAEILNSLTGSKIVQKHTISRVLPHIRASDITNPQQLLQDITQSNIREVLIIQGDNHGEERAWMTTTGLVETIKRLDETISVYCAIDPYRTSIKQELDYTKEKTNAGADGFFTQPFFEYSLLSYWMDRLSHLNVYWWFSPITTDGSMRYWEKQNNIPFPNNFTPGLAESVDFARKALEIIEKSGTNAYLMPIRTDPVYYASQILQK